MICFQGVIESVGCAIGYRDDVKHGQDGCGDAARESSVLQGELEPRCTEGYGFVSAVEESCYTATEKSDHVLSFTWINRAPDRKCVNTVTGGVKKEKSSTIVTGSRMLIWLGLSPFPSRTFFIFPFCSGSLTVVPFITDSAELTTTFPHLQP